MANKKIAVIGATGFTGSELVRLLHHHPDVDIALMTSESRAGEHISATHPFLTDLADITLESVSAISSYDIDLAFLALPHGVSMEFAEKLAPLNIPIVDLSGDFRLSSPEVYEAWYNKPHSFPSGFARAAYGLPELFDKQIRQASIVANPGCYPTSVILAVAPLIKTGLVSTDRIISDSKSGITGAGAKAKAVNMFSSVSDNFKAYGLKSHRHTIEIQEQLQGFSTSTLNIQFTPHLLPIDRGILSTIYLQPLGECTDAQLQEVYKEFYRDAPFVRWLDMPPSTKSVRGTNLCDIHATFDKRTGNVIVLSAIDNLVKGAAGQAIQNMNLLFGWEGARGLDMIPLYP